MYKTLLSALAFVAIAAFAAPSPADARPKGPVAAHVVHHAAPRHVAARHPVHVNRGMHNVRARDNHARNERLRHDRRSGR